VAVCRNLGPTVDYPELHVQLLIELRFAAHTHAGEVLDVDELVALRPVGVRDGLDHLQTHEGRNAPRLELHAAAIRGWQVEGDVEVRDIALGTEIERPSPRLDDGCVLSEQAPDVQAGAPH